MEWEKVKKILKKYFPRKAVEKWSPKTTVRDIADEVVMYYGWKAEDVLNALAEAIIEAVYKPEYPGKRVEVWQVWNIGYKAEYVVVAKENGSYKKIEEGLTISYDDTLEDLFA